MTTETMTLTDFLLARLAEDEAVARGATGGPWEPFRRGDPFGPFGVVSSADGWDPVPDTVGVRRSDAEHIARHDPARVLAEVEAKRQIMEQAVEASGDRGQVIGEFCVGTSEIEAAWAEDPGKLILYALATVYDDHPEYRKEWRQ